MSFKPKLALAKPQETVPVSESARVTTSAGNGEGSGTTTQAPVASLAMASEGGASWQGSKLGTLGDSQSTFKTTPLRNGTIGQLSVPSKTVFAEQKRSEGVNSSSTPASKEVRMPSFNQPAGSVRKPTLSEGTFFRETFTNGTGAISKPEARFSAGSYSSSAMTPLPNVSHERSLVVTSKPGSSGYNGVQEDPFVEVTRTIQTQSRRIKELEQLLKDQSNTNQQLELKLSNSDEHSKRSNAKIMELEASIAHLQKSLDHKDEELDQTKQKTQNLESDRARMLGDYTRLAQALDVEKKKFIFELKKSSDVILVMQNVRKKLSLDDPAPVQVQQVSVSVTPEQGKENVEPEAKRKLEEAIAQIQKMEKQSRETVTAFQERLDEYANAYEQLEQHRSLLQDILAGCPACLDLLQQRLQQLPDENADPGAPAPTQEAPAAAINE